MSNPSQVRFSGPLAGYSSGFRAALEVQGYRREPAASQLQLASHLSRWLESRGLGVVDLTPETIEEFLAARRLAGRTLFRLLVALDLNQDELYGHVKANRTARPSWPSASTCDPCTRPRCVSTSSGTNSALICRPRKTTVSASGPRPITSNWPTSSPMFRSSIGSSAISGRCAISRST
jgi:hypothetical protein